MVEFKMLVDKQVTEDNAYSFTTPVKFWKMKSWIWVLLAVLEELGRAPVYMRQKSIKQKKK